jgi:ABC-type polysaccharide/polyol phosphate transport system ATPase subunit
VSAVRVEGVSKRFRLYAERNQTFKAAVLRGGRADYTELWALRDVSLEVGEGTTFGLVGDNGSGKSTLLKCLARILVPDGGRIEVRGRVAALLELGSGFHPELTGRQNVFLNGTILGLSRRELERRYDDIVAFAGLEHAMDQPVKNYSSGMYARLGFAVATSVDPEVLLVDEVLAVGDAGFQRRCAERIAELRGQGRTIVLVSHASESVRALCDEVAWLESGQVKTTGPTAQVLDRYLRAGVEERPETTGDPERWGTGEVHIEHVELHADGSGSTTRLTTGEPTEVRVRIGVSDGAVASPVVGLGIWAVDGTHLWGGNTAGQGLDLGLVSGSREVVLQLPRLPLQPGTYDLEVAVVDRSLARTYDHHRRAVRFDVRYGDAHDSGGYLSPGGRWSVSAG